MRNIQSIKHLSDDQLIVELLNATTNMVGYTAAELEKIQRTLSAGLKMGMKLKEIESELALSGGKLAKDARMIARTFVKAYGQIRKLQKAVIARIEWYTYNGIKRDDTRTFCRELIDRSDPTFHIDEIMKMKNGILEPVIYFCGGWECAHDWEPDPFHR